MNWSPICPVGIDDSERILLAHGEGFRLSRRLVRERIVSRFDNRLLAPLADAACLPQIAGVPAFTTDSFVVTPLFFPGGDIGTLAVFGTANDLAVVGARPRWLALSLILEEGLPLVTLERVLDSIASAARSIEIEIVTGDTKVVPRGAADQLFLNAAGVGELIDPVPPGPQAIGVGDVLLVSGPIGRHGIAVLAARDNLGFEPPPRSDCGSLFGSVEALRSSGIACCALRDATRGGVAAVLHEWAAACQLTFEIDEGNLPVTDEVRGACELLGLDPLFVACEGTMMIAVAPALADRTLAVLQQRPESAAASVIGRVTQRGIAPVVVRRMLGRLQPLDEPAGAPLPRIC
ncbi:MAG TPA: hydrogenase expression/formation protein HypE [Pirellulaceae bacterium]|nr:hydrogenase expression/formation protein HypE [Pirellulaceae bacterium]